MGKALTVAMFVGLGALGAARAQQGIPSDLGGVPGGGTPGTGAAIPGGLPATGGTGAMPGGKPTTGVPDGGIPMGASTQQGTDGPGASGALDDGGGSKDR